MTAVDSAQGALTRAAMLGSPGWTQLAANPRKSARLANFIRRAAVNLSVNCRLRRGQLFVERLRPTADDRVLDLGGGRGGYMAQTLPFRSNVTIADLDPGSLKMASEHYGFDTLCLDGSAKFAVPDAAYDVVFCSSVIEHVTGPKEIVYDLARAGEFTTSAKAARVNFAAEVRRIAKRYFVQTPYKYFPLEQHSFLPFLVVLLPRRWHMRLMKFLATRWFKPSQPDFRLLTIQEMQALFPDAEIVLERYCGFVKSIVAIKS
jgi:SAM-dependent methyltransferase